MEWCAAAEDIPLARLSTATRLVGQMGVPRSGGVTWLEANGDYAIRVLDLIESHAGPDASCQCRRLRLNLANRGGWLVIAEIPTLPR